MYAVCDIGGTHTRIALAEGDKLTTDPVIVATPKDFDKGMKVIQTNLSNLIRGRSLDAMAVGFAGSLDKANSAVFNAPHLPQWNDKPLKKELEQIFNTHVYVENDTAMVGLGEAVYGAGKGSSIVAYLTISTGVGGVRIVNGRLDEQALGFEPGHQIILDPRDARGEEQNPHMCQACQMYGHLEGFVGGGALQERYGKPPSEIHDEKIWDEVARFLAYGINNTLVYWSPDVVVLGGGLIVHEAIKIDKVNIYLKDIVKIYPELPPLKKCELRDSGGLYGGLAYIKNNA